MEDSSEALRGNEKDVSPLVTKHQVIRRILANIAKQFPIQSPIHNLNLTEFRTLNSAYHWHHHSTHGPLNIYPGPSRSRLPSSLRSFHRRLKWRWCTPRKTVVEQYLLNYIKVPSVYPAIWGFHHICGNVFFFLNKYKGFT